MIKEVIFDIDDTLYDYEVGDEAGMERTAVYAEAELQMSREEFLALHEKLRLETNKRLGMDNAAIHSRSIRLQNMLELMEKPIFPHLRKMYDLYWQAFFEICKPEPGCMELMEKLKKRGITIGIGTDMTARMQYEKLEKLGYAPYINHMVTSQEAGYEKPHRLFMERCIQKAGCRPEECIFVGDNIRKDVLGAANAGMYAVWYNAKCKERPADVDLKPEQYHEIRSYQEFLPWMDGLAGGEE